MSRRAAAGLAGLDRVHDCVPASPCLCLASPALLQDQIDQVAADDSAQFGENLVWWVSHGLFLKGPGIPSTGVIMERASGDVKQKTGLSQAPETSVAQAKSANGTGD